MEIHHCSTSSRFRFNAREQPAAWMRRRLRTTFWIGALLVSVQVFSAWQRVTVAENQSIPHPQASINAAEFPGLPQQVAATSKSSQPASNPNSQVDSSHRSQAKTGNPTASEFGPTLPKTSLRIHRQAVPPVGWRRTADGWQHVSSWQTHVDSISLSQRMIAQRESQPDWLRHTMTYIRRTPPGCFALAQIGGVALLFLIVGRRKHSNRKTHGDHKNFEF